MYSAAVDRSSKHNEHLILCVIGSLSREEKRTYSSIETSEHRARHRLGAGGDFSVLSAPLLYAPSMRQERSI